MVKTKTGALSGSGGHPGRMNKASAPKKKHWSVKLREELAEARRQRDLMYDVVLRYPDITFKWKEAEAYHQIRFARDAEKVIWAGESTWREGAMNG